MALGYRHYAASPCDQDLKSPDTTNVTPMKPFGSRSPGRFLDISIGLFTGFLPIQT
jgi:hypothetical protein